MLDRMGPVGKGWMREAMKELRQKIETTEEEENIFFVDVLKRKQKAEALHLAVIRFMIALRGKEANPNEYQERKWELQESLEVVKCDKNLGQLEGVRKLVKENEESIDDP